MSTHIMLWKKFFFIMVFSLAILSVNALDNLVMISANYQFEDIDSISIDDDMGSASIIEEDIDGYDSVENDIDEGYEEQISQLSGTETTSPEVLVADSSESKDVLNAEEQIASGCKIPFYRRWWFSLLIVLALVPLVRKAFLNEKKKYLQQIEDLNKEVDKVKNTLKETEGYFEEMHQDQNKNFTIEKELRYQFEGISKFSEILSNNKNNTEILGQKIVSELVDYVGANSGAMYIIKDDEGEEPVLEFLGGFAPDAKQITASFKVGEGYVGTCFKDGKIMELNNASDVYIKVYSGLGESRPDHLIFVPLVQDENKLGVIEIASFKKLEEYKIKFIEKLSENIASTMAINSANEKMKIMLDQSREQTEQLRSQEEEMKQNLEEMQTAQEELQRHVNENKVIQENLIKEKALLDAVMNSLPEYIYFKDKECKFIRISNSMLPLFPVNNIDDMIGKSDFDFQSKEVAQKYYDEEQKIMKTGKGFINKVKHEIMKNGIEQWSSITKMPLYDKTGQCIGTFGITKNITEYKKMEMEDKTKNEELMAQEEELRQNLEEMETAQEELQRHVDEHMKVQKELIKEKALLDSLLNNLPDFIYFKDNESKFIRISESMLPIFPVKSTKEMLGKSDFDFQAKEIAQKYFNEEQEIIKTGKGVVDAITHETFENGIEKWSSITKMPLIDENGDCIGTFGITKDISEIKKLEIEANEKAEALLAHEEELRQNLEEMKTVQEDLQRQKESLDFEKSLMDALMNNIPDTIYFKDTECRFIRVSKSLVPKFNVKSEEEIYGKSDFDFHGTEHAQGTYDDEQRIMKTRKARLNIIEEEAFDDGRVTWGVTSKMPLIGRNGKVIGTFGITSDITELKKMEIDIKEKNEALQAQEEELRQNLEEMHTIQDNLQKQINAKEKLMQNLVKQNAYLDALMNNLTDWIYFKDKDCKFLRVSKSMVELFDEFNKPEQIIGKSDYDFFDEKGAKRRYDDEQKIIKTRKGITNFIDHEITENGVERWVSITKLPLINENNKVIGTFGISRDVTDIKKLELEARGKEKEYKEKYEQLAKELARKKK